MQQSLEALSKGRTTFTIAHRLTTIRGASTILVLTENGIEEQGSHEELLRKNGLYSSPVPALYRAGRAVITARSRHKRIIKRIEIL